MKQREIFLRRYNEANVRVIETTNSHIPPANLYCDVLYPPIKILDEKFNSTSNLFQDHTSIVPEGYLAKSKSNPSQPHCSKLNKNGSFACDTNCNKFKSCRMYSHTIAVAEKEEHLEKCLGLV